MRPPFAYDPEKLPREKARHYISATEDEIKLMLQEVGRESLDQVMESLPKNSRFDQEMNLPPELSYDELASHLFELSQKNNVVPSFIGDGLPQYQIPELVDKVCQIRGLTTAYTPYQPERSQGTLGTLWVYQNLISQLTGFEAINASLYDRSTCLLEALNCAKRLVRGSDTALVLGSIYPGDLEVLKSIAAETSLKILTVPLNRETGITDIEAIKMVLDKAENVCAIAFPQVNSLGNLEDVDAITDLCEQHNLKSITVVDPMMLATGGLKPPSEFGSQKLGSTMIVGEGQHLCLGPNYGGPGLGIFGIRYNQQDKISIRQTAGRYVGKTVDAYGNICYSMVLSTREQHIRREKATSNICSNQSFVATIAGAAILARGEQGMAKAIGTARDNARSMAEALSSFEGVELRFPQTAFCNEFVLRLPVTADNFINQAQQAGLQVGVDVSERTGHPNDLLISFFDTHTEEQLQKLLGFFEQSFGAKTNLKHPVPEIQASSLRQGSVQLPSFSPTELETFYQKLGNQNISPDYAIYPLGSCTMKYNPYINDWAAGLDGFTQIHPQAPVEDAQGCLELLYEIQEQFKAITGLPAVTTQPVAGAQGELVGIKMFQAYHKDKGENRDIILIPRTAHGTNPATATMAGFETKVVDGKKVGIILVESDTNGQIDFEQLQNLINEYKNRIAGIMVTNPNTAGVFEDRFKEMADLIHDAGGLVYMDGANMNAIAGWVDLGKIGVDAVHNNLHKTWTIPHGGGGPGDAIVAVSEKLVPYLPGVQVIKTGERFELSKPSHSIGSFHRHFGNFAHKVRTYTYLRALGAEGIKRMSGFAVLSSQYLYKKLHGVSEFLPKGADQQVRMHEFIVTLSEQLFKRIENNGVPKAQIMPKIGKLFLDFGLHAPTVAFPEVYGLMIEPTESYTKAELDRFLDIVKAIYHLVNEYPQVLKTVPHFTPVGKVDEVSANKNLNFYEPFTSLPEVLENKVQPHKLASMGVSEITKEVLQAHKSILK